LAEQTFVDLRTELFRTELLGELRGRGVRERDRLRQQAGVELDFGGGAGSTLAAT